MIELMCKNFGFEYSELGAMHRIKSRFDVWYLEERPGDKYMLYHQNSPRYQGKDGMWHRQMKRSMELLDILKYIKSHDKKYTRDSSLLRFQRTLEQII